MRFLRILGLVLVHARAVGHVCGAEAALDLIARGHHRLGGHVDAVGPHVGDVAGLIQTLRRTHALLGPHAELAAGFLLQGRCHEGRIGIARGGLCFHRFHAQAARGHGLNSQLGCRGGRNIELVELLAAQHRQARLELLPAGGDKIGRDRPVFTGAERLDLHLAVHDQPQADRLHAPGGFCAGQLAPEHGRQGEAHQVIQGASGQIGIDQRLIHLARILHRLGHGGLGDGVERHPADLFSLFQR